MDLSTLGLIALVVVLLYILVKAADLIEDGFVFLSKRIGISEFFIGFFVLSIVSSLPEFSIAISSNNLVPELSVGNLMGASLILLTLVVGLTVLKFKSIDFKGRFGEKEVIGGLLIIGLTIGSILDQYISLVEGIVLMFVYTSFILFVFNHFRKREAQNISAEVLVPARKVLVMFVKASIGVGLIIVASSLLVDTILEIGKVADINETLVGIFVLAVGTNTPEITILSRSNNPSERKLAVGNIIGSASINTFILGMLAVLSQGIELSNVFFNMIPVLVILSITLVAFGYFSWTGRSLNRQEGFALIALYVSFILTELIIFLGGLKL